MFKEVNMIQVGKFNIRIVQRGEKWGLHDCLTWDDEPAVEFYDSRYNKGFRSRGQFISHYYLRTLLERPNRALSLDLGLAEWTVTAEEMRDVLRYLRGFELELKQGEVV
jgi:hypothetical protein